MISSPDLVLAVRGQKRGRGGEGKGEEETSSGKIRLRGPESGPRVNCELAFHLNSTDNALRSAFENTVH